MDAFQEDDKTASAVMMKLEVIGEAVMQIPNEICQRYPQIPCKEMAGLRDKLIHFYIWCRLPTGLESDYREDSASQAGNSEHSTKCGLTPAAIKSMEN